MSSSKGKGRMSLGTAVLFDGSSEGGCKIVTLRIDGSVVIQTTLVNITKDGMSFIRDHGWKKMLASSGILEIVECMRTGK